MGKILIVEDNADIREMLIKHLELEGMEAVGAAGGKEALATIFRLKPELIVLDIMLPEVDGWEVLLKIREDKEFTNFKELPVIMLSAKTEDISKLTAFRHGADDYLTKPFNPEELTARIRAVLKRGSAQKPGMSGTAAPVKIPVGDGPVFKLVDPDKIVFCENRDRRTFVGLAEGYFPCSLSLLELEDRLPKKDFLRLHRSYLVNTSKVMEVKKNPGGRYAVSVEAGGKKREIPVSRRSTREFKAFFVL